ncbi:MAG: helix-turn-helix transcriptional regulator [Chitinophagales bacterium]|nr:helix-turn-helix transcriptional regulator [Chitinophagales bacterium]
MKNFKGMGAVNDSAMKEQKEFLAQLGKRIRQERMQAKLSQQQLAGKCDFEKSNMSRLEAGKVNPSILTLRKVCLGLNTSISDITLGL